MPVLNILPNDWKVHPDCIEIYGINTDTKEAVVHRVRGFKPRFCVQSRAYKSLGKFRAAFEEFLEERGRICVDDEWTHHSDLVTIVDAAMRKTNFGYTAEDTFPTLTLSFERNDVFYQFKNKCLKKSREFVTALEVHNYADVVEQLCIANDISPHEPISIDGTRLVRRDIPPPPLCTVFFDIETLSSAYVDAREEGSKNTVPTNPRDVIISICLYFQLRNGGTAAYTLYHYGAAEDAEFDGEGTAPYTHVRSASEPAMLRDFIRIWREHRPDVCMGYNSSGFDWNYVYQRCLLHNVPFDGLCWGGGMKAEVVKVNSENNQKGEMAFYQFNCPGVLDIDIMKYIKEVMPSGQYSDYKLNTALKVELKEEKMDFCYYRVFDSYSKNDPVEMGQMLKYNFIDTEPLSRLAQKLNVFDTYREIANACGIPVRTVLERGISRRVSNLIFAMCGRTDSTICTQALKDYWFKSSLGDDNREIAGKPGVLDSRFIKRQTAIFTDPDWHLEPQKYEGGYNPPYTPGYYEILLTLDFSSLYPSIYQGHGICYSSIVTDEPKYLERAKAQGAVRYCWIAKYVQEVKSGICFPNHDDAVEGLCRRNAEMQGMRDTIYARGLLPGNDAYNLTSKEILAAIGQEPEAETVRQIRKFIYDRVHGPSEFQEVEVEEYVWVVPSAARLIPAIEDLLIAHRKKAKKMMAKFDKGESQYRYYNAKQAAYKILCNSVYGFTGGTILPMKEMAMLVTSIGRESLKRVIAEVRPWGLRQSPPLDLNVVGGDTYVFFCITDLGHSAAFSN
jgi:DNA polymerase elongation subunit (family B)